MAATREQMQRTAALLEQLAREAKALAASEAVLIPEHHPSDLETFTALRAAVSYGCAIGLRRAAELIEQQNTRSPCGADACDE